MDNMLENNVCDLHSPCTICHLRDDCPFNFPQLIDEDGHQNSHQRPISLQKKQQLFRMGEQFNHLYFVKSGCLKNYFYEFDGNEQIIDFVLPGDVIGLDSINNRNYVSSAIALETTSVCKLPFRHFMKQSQQNTVLYNQFIGLAGERIKSSYNLLLVLRYCSAETKIVSFLLNYSLRKSKYGYSRFRFNLSMSRSDIATYLGLTKETVSRVLNNFVNKDTLAITGRHVTITDMDGLMQHAKMTHPDVINGSNFPEEGKKLMGHNNLLMRM